MITEKKLTCIVCPNSCSLTVQMLNNAILSINGHKCPRGVEYGRQETLDPRRYLTAVVAADRLKLSMVPVKSAGPLPKEKLLPAMEQVRKFRLSKAVKIGTVLISDLAGTGIALIAARDVQLA